MSSSAVDRPTVTRRDPEGDLRDQLIAEPAVVPSVLIQARGRKDESLGKPNDQGHVVRPCAQAGFLGTSRLGWIQRGPAADEQGPHALGPVELVGPDRQEIYRELAQVQRQLAGGLNRVGMKRDLPFSAQGAQLGNRIDRPYLIVGEDHRDDRRVLPQPAFEVLWGNAPATIDGEELEFKYFLGELFGGPQHGMMLDRCRENVACPSYPGCRTRRTAQGKVVALRSAAGEGDLLRQTVEHSRDIRAGRLDRGFGLLTPTVNR